MPPMTTPQECVDVLNRIHEADPTVLSALIAHRVPCNRALADDPTVQVGAPEGQPDGPYEVGLLGIINGIFGINPLGRPGYGYIAAKYEGGHGAPIGALLGFDVLGAIPEVPDTDEECGG